MKQIVIKTPEEIAKMRHSGALLAKVFAMLDEVIVEGISTMEINDRAEAFIVEELKSRPASKGQYDFPYVLNTSVDDVVCHGVQRHAEQAGYSIVREYCGHGIGRDMHEEPAVLHYGQPGSGMALQEGMVFTIEPMINQGDRRIKQKKDGWTVVTRDKKLSAQWEHTVAVTADGVEILTLRDEERRAGYAERY